MLTRVGVSGGLVMKQSLLAAPVGYTSLAM
jgi:hypothetical protein